MHIGPRLEPELPGQLLLLMLLPHYLGECGIDILVGDGVQNGINLNVLGNPLLLRICEAKLLRSIDLIVWRSVSQAPLRH